MYQTIPRENIYQMIEWNIEVTEGEKKEE